MTAPAPFSPAPIPVEIGGQTSVAVPSQAVMPKPKLTATKKEVPSTANKVIGAKIVLQYRGSDGKVYEADTIIDPSEHKVQSYALTVEEKHEKKRDPETKDLIGFEDTGERLLTFKLRYHVR
jgi:hypothetical protein